jgi:hypothetical protein
LAVKPFSVKTNLQSLRDMAQDHRFLFNDRQELVLKDNDVLVMIINQRIGDHIKEEERKLEAERERIRKEEAERVEREHAEKVERERIRKEEAERERIAAQHSADEQERTRTYDGTVMLSAESDHFDAEAEPNRAETHERNESFKADAEQLIDDVRNDDNHQATDASDAVDGNIITGFNSNEEEVFFLRAALFDIYYKKPNPVGIAAAALRQVGAIE